MNGKMNKNKSRSELLFDNSRKDCDTIFDPIVKAYNFSEHFAIWDLKYQKE